MDITTLTIEKFMHLQLLVDTYTDNEKQLTIEIIKYIHGDLKVEKRVADLTIEKVMFILNNQPDFTHRFKYNDIEYGFIPNLNEITTGEFIDLDEYIKDGKQLHKIAAILYRPVTKAMGNMYQIEPYEGTSKYADIMKGVDYKIVMGAVVFFCQLAKSLSHHTNIYINQEMKKNQKNQMD